MLVPEGVVTKMFVAPATPGGICTDTLVVEAFAKKAGAGVVPTITPVTPIICVPFTVTHWPPVTGPEVFV
jgi:hypothetical protein